jgi:hypothetical protein
VDLRYGACNRGGRSAQVVQTQAFIRSMEFNRKSLKAQAASSASSGGDPL